MIDPVLSVIAADVVLFPVETVPFDVTNLFMTISFHDILFHDYHDEAGWDLPKLGG